MGASRRQFGRADCRDQLLSARMGEFNASHALRDVAERSQQLASGEKIVPVSAAVIAVLAALATLFANHSSVSSLSQKNLSALYQSKGADQYNFYEAKLIRAQVDRALLDSGSVNADRRSMMETRWRRESLQAQEIFKQAQSYDAQSEEHMRDSEAFMGSYQSHEVAATLFEVSIVFVSVTALMRGRALLGLAAVATLVGLGFFGNGLLH